MISSLLFSLLPSFLNVGLRRLFGQKIGKGSKIRFGTILKAKNIIIGNNVKIGPFSFIKANEFKIGDNSSIKSLTIISTRIVSINKFVHIAPLSIISSEFTENSKIVIGDHSRIFPFCWLDSGEGITLGKNVGVGGHSLIFTHGVWANYLDGGPVSYGPVKINDNVWLPWKVFILPNVELGKNTIVGANSLVNKSFPENILIGGSPAKILKENVNLPLANVAKLDRANEILTSFASYIKFKIKLDSKIELNLLIFEKFKIVIDEIDNLKKGDLLFLINTQPDESLLAELSQKGISVLNHKEKTLKLHEKNKVLIIFSSFLRRYGIRLYIN